MYKSLRADLGHDHETVGIRMERILDDLIGYMRAAR